MKCNYPSLRPPSSGEIGLSCSVISFSIVAVNSAICSSEINCSIGASVSFGISVVPASVSIRANTKLITTIMPTTQTQILWSLFRAQRIEFRTPKPSETPRDVFNGLPRRVVPPFFTSSNTAARDRRSPTDNFVLAKNFIAPCTKLYVPSGMRPIPPQFGQGPAPELRNVTDAVPPILKPVMNGMPQVLQNAGNCTLVNSPSQGGRLSKELPKVIGA